MRTLQLLNWYFKLKAPIVGKGVGNILVVMELQSKGERRVTLKA